MKKILGLDLGTNSIGWALVNEAENNQETSEIIKLGVRVNPLTTDEKTDFEKGRPLSVNADRTLKRGARRNLQRYKQRRKNLIEILSKHHLIDDKTQLTEVGKNTTHQTLKLRAKAATDKIELNDFVKVLFSINKKRGYKSSRKTVEEGDGVAIDGMTVAKVLHEAQITPGQYALNLLKENKKYIPDFYRSDLQNEFDLVWNFQKTFYSDILDEKLYKALEGQGQQNSRKRFLAIKGIYTAENQGKRDVVKLQHYQWRANAISKQLSIEEVAYVLVEINNNLNNSSGYLGAISDRSKELYFNKITVGQYLYKQLQENPNTSLKKQVFYRQDYLEEFEQIWETQAKHHDILTPALKEEIRDVIIFYQRRLKSQKGLISFCQLESWEVEKKDAKGNTIINKTTGNPKKRTVGQRIIPKASPLFQEFKIWQNINNLEFKRTDNKTNNLFNQDIETEFKFDEDTRKLLFEELNVKGELKATEVLKMVGLNSKEWKCNFEKIEGNRTNQALFNIYQKIATEEGYGFDWSKKSANEIIQELKSIFPEIGIKPEILNFDANADDYDKQDSYQLWHLLYAAEDDFKITKEDALIYGNSNVNLKKRLHTKYGFKVEYTKWLASIKLQPDYGNLSSRAIRKILPFLQNGNEFSEACKLAGYNHSNSFNREQLDQKILKHQLDLLPKNSLRNPVVEKILNQMINLVNQVIDTYGKPDEIRIELARELKKSAKERKEATSFINQRTKENDDLRSLITKEFGIPNPTKNDVTRYRLWEELAPLGHKTVFTNQFIPKAKLFSKEIDIEHIIPKALLFDDSFSNKTLAYREINLKKRDRTAFDFIESDYNKELGEFKKRVETLYNKGKGISKGKYKKLLMSQQNLPDGFIERDLRNSQYIAKKAKQLLQELVREPIVSTSGKITNRLREDWDLINVMKELNLPKYKALGLTETQERKNNKKVEVIKDWTKRNDHRHHAMDALTVAFTTHSHIQYLNNLNARKDENHKKNSSILGIENNIMYKNTDGKKKFKAPLNHFRNKAKEHIESILISFKAKNKVVTKNINKTKKEKGLHLQETKTPRGQLHKETVYGQSKQPMAKTIKISKRTTIAQVHNVINPKVKSLLLEHLGKFDNKPTIAFDTKSLKKEPLVYNGEPIKEIHCYETVYTIRKEITPDLKIDKVIDHKIRDILKQRLADYGNKPKEAFSNLETNPIWLNKEKGIQIKRVTITGMNNVEALHEKKDHLGNLILDSNGKPIPSDFVSTGNNHHVAIYQDKNGKLEEKVVSFYEAVARVNANLPVVDTTYNQNKGWEFLFTMKQNEMFVFPSEDFDPKNIDLLDPKNSTQISKHLFRVQKTTSKDYFFRHHLETTVENTKETKDTSWIRTGLSGLEGIVKVRTNHLGQIVQIGEY